ncbi:uncharacterized protein LOC117323737 isoform X1 [Pecten maximus]|uniref:uncharacterized protein LOC117323737 isoform X1 n=2 Tax=Pecten maximus TaxID=6579 RepID=UPI001458BE38|nr:uncharacterized protein LOC117323737 isoform X1 [Pecten maximus]
MPSDDDTDKIVKEELSLDESDIPHKRTMVQGCSEKSGEGNPVNNKRSPKSTFSINTLTHHRMHRSAVRPFFCCGSQISLNSITDFVDQSSCEKEESDLTDLSDSDEMVDLMSDMSVERNMSKKSSTRRISNSRRKKCDMQDKNMRKKFWTIKFRGKLISKSSRLNTTDQELVQGAKSNESIMCTSYRRTLESSKGEITFEEIEPSSADTISLTEDDYRSGSHVGGAEGGFIPESLMTESLVSEGLMADTSRVPRGRAQRFSAPDLQRTTSEVFVMFRPLNSINFDELYPTEDVDERRIAERAREMKEGIELRQNILVPQFGASEGGGESPTRIHLVQAPPSPTSAVPRVPLLGRHYGAHSQVDYMHCLVPDILQITKCSFYWGVMDRYQAEKLLENKPEGTFLLRDSAQEEFLFSVSFRRYGRSLHARIEQWNHKFSFDSHDPGVFASDTVCGLIEHYKDPSCCMFFEPMLTSPLHRNFTFSLQHMCRSSICDNTTYDGVHNLPLPRSLKEYLMYYHYKQKVRVRRFDMAS